MPALASVMTASVVSGGISLTAPTNVVLPTPKPPAMTIFTDNGAAAARGAGGGAASDGAEAIEHLLEKGRVRTRAGAVGGRDVHVEEAVGEHVGEQNARHPERQVRVRGDLGDRQDIT